MSSIKIAIIGLGYVGLPLAVEFAKKYPVVGFDINQNRVDELQRGHDATLEIESEHLKSVLCEHNPISAGNGHGLYVSSDSSDLADANYYIVLRKLGFQQRCIILCL